MRKINIKRSRKFKSIKFFPFKLKKKHKDSKKERICVENIKNAFSKSEDALIKDYSLGKDNEPIQFVYCEGLTDSKQINQYLLHNIERILDESKNDKELFSNLEGRLPVRPLKKDESMKDVIFNVFSGELVLYFKKYNRTYFLSIVEEPNRTPDESNTEIALRGSKDGFTEDLSTNVALVRKRLRTNSLCNETLFVGERSKSKVALLYLDDVINMDIVDEVRKRINELDIDVLDSTAQLEELLSDSPLALFPLCEFVGRPDYVVDCLTRGRFAILVSGSPNAVIAPVNFTTLLRTPEDIHAPYHFVSLEVMLRFLGLVLAIFAPALYVAITTFHVEQVPFQLLTTISNGRFGLPFPIPVEAFIMLLFLELFREAVVRLAKPVGQSIALVGGLIIGDAAISGGLASPTLLVVVALSIVGTFTLVNQSLNGSVTIFRIFSLFLASVLGMFGFLISIFFTLWYLASLKSFNISYLSTGGATNLREFLATFGRLPWKYMKKRPSFMRTTDESRKGESS